MCEAPSDTTARLTIVDLVDLFAEVAESGTCTATLWKLLARCPDRPVAEYRQTLRSAVTDLLAADPEFSGDVAVAFDRRQQFAALLEVSTATEAHSRLIDFGENQWTLPDSLDQLAILTRAHLSGSVAQPVPAHLAQHVLDLLEAIAATIRTAA